MQSVVVRWIGASVLCACPNIKFYLKPNRLAIFIVGLAHTQIYIHMYIFVRACHSACDVWMVYMYICGYIAHESQVICVFVIGGYRGLRPALKAAAMIAILDCCKTYVAINSPCRNRSRCFLRQECHRHYFACVRIRLRVGCERFMCLIKQQNMHRRYGRH